MLRCLQPNALAVMSSCSLPFLTGSVSADETCMSPYMAKIVGQEDYVYIWVARHTKVMGDGSGQARDGRRQSGFEELRQDHRQTLSVGGRNEAHHSGLTDDRHYLWAGGLDTNKIFIFDVHYESGETHPAQDHRGFRGENAAAWSDPHTTYALPGRMLVTGSVERQGSRRPHGHGRIHERR